MLPVVLWEDQDMLARRAGTVSFTLSRCKQGKGWGGCFLTWFSKWWPCLCSRGVDWDMVIRRGEVVGVMLGEWDRGSFTSGSGCCLGLWWDRRLSPEVTKIF